MLDSSIGVDAVRRLCTCPMRRHKATQVASSIFPEHLGYSTLLWYVPPDHSMKTSLMVFRPPSYLSRRRRVDHYDEIGRRYCRWLILLTLRSIVLWMKPLS